MSVIDDIPREWRRLWWTRHRPTGKVYVVGRQYHRGERFCPQVRRFIVTAMYLTPATGSVCAAVYYPDLHLDSTLLLHPSEPDAFDVEFIEEAVAC